MHEDMSVAMQLYADASRMTAGMRDGERGVNRFASTAKRQFNAVKRALTSVEGKFASVGVSIGAVATIMQSAKLDKSLTQISQTAGAAKSDVAGLRSELFGFAKDSGQDVDDLKQGFDNAVQAGLNFKEAKNVIDGTNTAMAVTSANADNLTASLTVASTAFDFDLANQGQALELLDQMTVAGRLGNAELENLSSIFGRVGPNSAAAGMGFAQTLAFIEGLSQIERQPERLATLADSTLRLFNNLNYMKTAQKATKVKFFDADGSRRDALAVIADIKKQYDKLDTEKGRALYIQKAFGKADLDTIKGMRLLLSGSMLNDISGFTRKIETAGGTLKRDMDEATNNAVDQAGRLKARLREAADGFAQPINNAFTKLARHAMNSKENGGMGMDGQDLMLTAGGAAIGTAILAKLGGKAASGIANKIMGIGGGIATGKALETAAGIQPVYVVNMDEGGMGGAGLDPTRGKNKPKGRPKMKSANPFALKNLKTTGTLLGSANMASLRMMGAGAMTTAGGVGAASLGSGYALGNTQLGGEIALHIMKFFGSKDAAFALDTLKAEAKINGTLKVLIDKRGEVSASLKTNQPGLKVRMDNGPLMVGN